MVPFVVKLLSSNIPIHQIVNLILRSIYDHRELIISIARVEMKKMLILYTKNIYFTYKWNIFVQTNDVAIGSPLRLVLADIYSWVTKTLLPDFMFYI